MSRAEDRAADEEGPGEPKPSNSNESGEEREQVRGEERDEKGGGAAEAEEGETRQVEDKGRSAAEWTTFAISLLIVLGIAGLVLFQYVAGGAEPPRIETRAFLEETRREADRYYVPVEVTNQGDLTAEDVIVSATLKSGEEQETAEITILFLAGGETEQGVAVFSRDPRQGELEVAVTSYIQP